MHNVRYYRQLNPLVDISETCIQQITFSLLKQFHGNLKTNLILPYNCCLGNNQQFCASWQQFLSH